MELNEVTKDFDIDEFLARPSSLPEDCVFHFPGLSANASQQLSAPVSTFLRTFGIWMNLERLAEVTIAYDYSSALAGIDQGTGWANGLTASREPFATGVAMAARILKNGVPHCHLVIDAVAVVPLVLDPTELGFQEAVYLLAHECGHIDDLIMQDRAFPGVILQKELTQYDGTLHQIASACWDEYAACRMSASFGKESILRSLEQTFCAATKGLRSCGNDHIRRYRLHGDIGRLLVEIVAAYGNSAKYFSYLIGHIDGLGRNLEEAAPQAVEVMNQDTGLERALTCIQHELRAMWRSRRQWSGFEVFTPLRSAAKQLLGEAGLVLHEQDGGRIYVDVPYSPDTIPNGCPL